MFLPLSPEFRFAPSAVKSLRSAPRLLRCAPALRVTAPTASLRSRLKRKKAKENREPSADWLDIWFYIRPAHQSLTIIEISMTQEIGAELGDGRQVK